MTYDEEQDDIRLGFIVSGIVLMVVASLMMVFIPVGVKEAFGLGFIIIIGLGLTVAGSPDPRKK